MSSSIASIASGQSEEAAELLAEMKSLFVPIKSWYNSISAEAVDVAGRSSGSSSNNDQRHLIQLKEKYGDFPMFSRDLLKWEGWRDVKRQYLAFLDNSTTVATVATATTVATVATAAGKASDLISHENRGLETNDIAAATTKNVTLTINESSSTVTTETKKKRSSRWANRDNNETDNHNSDNNTHGDNTDNQNGPERKRTSRWARGRDETPKELQTTMPQYVNNNIAATNCDPVLAAFGLTPTTANNPLLLPSSNLTSTIPPERLPELQSLQQRLRIANARLTNLESEAARIDALPRSHPDRSPSPPPVYNPDGSRKNTRAQRWKENYTEERAECLERIMELMPTAFQPPGFLTKRKRSRKIPIPVEEHPTYNFIGLIIGPRGKTQKDMENKTGCKIAIRGKGSIKEGAKGRLRQGGGLPMEGDDEPLHVVITGDDPAAIDAAAEMVLSMLVVIDDEKNVHKQNQLRELALLNGTLKESTDEWCIICGERGHKNYECPKRFAIKSSSSTVVIKCAICGDSSHPTRDCVMKATGVMGETGDLTNGLMDSVDGENKVKQLDSDYSAFMAELEGKTNASDYEAANVAVAKSGIVGGALPTSLTGLADSVLTIIQPARIVKKSAEDYDESAVDSYITSISSTAVPNVDDPSKEVIDSNGLSTISLATSGHETGVTTINTTIPTPTIMGSGVNAATSAVTCNLFSSLPTALPPPPLPAIPPPSFIGCAPGVANAALGSTATLSHPPPPVAMTPGVSTGGGFLPPPPPPPVAGPQPPLPPPPAQGVPGAYQPLMFQQQGLAYHYQQQAGYPPQPFGQFQQQQTQWGAGNSISGWDPNSYYDTSGAGGLNWWDSSEAD